MLAFFCSTKLTWWFTAPASLSPRGQEYRLGGLDEKTNTDTGLAVDLLSHDRVPCLTGAVAMATIVSTVVVIALLLLIVAEPGQYSALHSFCWASLPLSFVFWMLHMISLLSVPPGCVTEGGHECQCTRNTTAICCRTTNITSCWQPANKPELYLKVKSV